MTKSKFQNNDPFVTILNSIFRGLIWLVMLPFRRFLKDQGRERAKVEFQGHWTRIDELVAQNNWREAVTNADILLGRALQAVGVSGQTIGDQLKAADKKLSRELLDAAWSAHKVRNTIAHELHYQLSEKEAREALYDFKRVLRNLGLL